MLGILATCTSTMPHILASSEKETSLEYHPRQKPPLPLQNPGWLPAILHRQQTKQQAGQLRALQLLVGHLLLSSFICIFLCSFPQTFSGHGFHVIAPASEGIPLSFKMLTLTGDS